MLFTLAFRTVVMFLVILITMRLLGKRQMGQLELNELVVAIMLSEIAVSPITNPDHRLLQGIIPVIVLLFCELGVSFATAKSVRLRSFVVGRPSIIIEDGKVNQRELRKNRLTITELSEHLRGQGHTDYATIKYAILEVGGTMSIIPFAQHSPATHGALNLAPEDKGLPRPIINEGRVFDENLKKLGLDRNWLEKELKSRGALKPQNVFLLSVDEKQNIYFVQKEGP